MVKNELMISDWYNWYANGEYYHFRVDQDTFQLDDSTISNFKPISLTTKILLENGFKAKGNEYTRYEYFGDGGISVTVIDEEDGRFSISMYNRSRFDEEERRINIEKEFVKVHQFQHLLRDCNINIDLNLKNDGQY